MLMSGWKTTGLVLIAVTGLCAAIIASMGYTEPAIRLLIRDTARISVTLFTLAFAASSLHSLLHRSWTEWLLKNRRYIGVSFAGAHFAHLALLVALGLYFPRPFLPSLSATTLVGGGLAYLFIALMTATSFDRTAAMIGPRAWRTLHTVGAYYIWILFAQAYIPRAIKDPWYIPLTAILVAGMATRPAAWFAKRLRSGRIEALTIENESVP